MPDAEQPNYRLVTNPNQLRKPKRPRQEVVVVDEVEVDTPDGPVPSAWTVQQLTALEVDEHNDNLRRYDKDGNWIGDDLRNQQLKLLWIALRDNHGNRLWKTWQEAVKELGQYPQSAITKLMQGYAKASSPTVQVVAGNSASPPTESSQPA